MGLSVADRALCDGMSKPDLVTMFNHRLANLQQANESLQSELKRLREQNASILARSVPASIAEGGRLGGFRLAIAKAADLAETPDGCPTALSEGIRAIKDPIPRWDK